MWGRDEFSASTSFMDSSGGLLALARRMRELVRDCDRGKLSDEAGHALRDLAYDINQLLDVEQFFLTRDTSRLGLIFRLALKQFAGRGIRVDAPLPQSVTEGTDNGCWVRAWVWLDFENTDFDKRSSASE